MAIIDYKAKEIRPNGGYCCPETSNCPRKSICNDLETKLSEAEKANAEMLSKVMTVNSENIALQSDLGTAEKKAEDILYRAMAIISHHDCKKHDGENCPPYQEFFERLKGHCCLCSIDKLSEADRNIKTTFELSEQYRKELSAANAEIKRLKKYIKSLTIDTFHNPNEI
jgi:hypothetical protein